MTIPYRAALWAGLICGVLDGICAIVLGYLSGADPVRVFQGIASGLLGRAAFQGGIGSAGLGAAIHVLVAFTAAHVYYFASHRLPLLIRHALRCGVAFGVLVHLFMTFVVIPSSAIGMRPFVLTSFITYLLVSMVVVGPSISLTIRHFARLTTRDRPYQ